MDSFLKDLVYGWRMLLKRPGPAIVAILALTLAIGANTAIFSVVNGVLLRPLGYTAAERLVILWEANPGKNIRDFDATPPNYKDWKEQQHSFSEMAAFRPEPSMLTGNGLPERVEGALVSPDLFRLLDAKMRLGRPFLAEEDQPGRNHVAVLSYGLWQRRFGGDKSILGKNLTVNGNDYVVVGVADKSFQLFNTASEIWVPYTLDAKELTEPDGDPSSGFRSAMHTIKVLGRLKPGVSIEQARQQMQFIARGLQQQYAETNAGWTVSVVGLREQLVGNVRSTLFMLLAAVGFVLLIACTNVANLLLARVSTRQREMAIRTALGAGYGRIIRQLLTESILISGVSGVLGLLLAYASVRALAAFNLENIPRISEITVDGQVLLFTFLVAMFTGVIFGLAPALMAAKAKLNDVLKAAGRSSMASLRSRQLRNALVIFEVAVSVVLLVGAALMIRSLVELENVNPGFRTDHILTMRLTLPKARYSGLKVGRFYEQLLGRIENVPGVLAAGITRDVPLSGTDASLNFTIENRPALSTAEQPRAKFRAVNAGYFSAMQIPLLKGRYFTNSDGPDSAPVAVINDVLARMAFPGEDPIGKRFKNGFDTSPWYTIVGVIGNVKHSGLDSALNPEMYFPYLQVPPTMMSFVEGTMTLVVRTGAEPASMAHPISAQVLALDPDEAVFKVATMQELFESSVAQPRFRAWLLGLFAVIALVLAGTGLYGVISYSVSQRSNELGIRAALGAQKSDLMRLVLGEGAWLATTGVLIGVTLAFAVAGTIGKLLYGVKSHDPLTFISIPVLLVAVAVFASYVPARRATLTDPNVVLRSE